MANYHTKDGLINVQTLQDKMKFALRTYTNISRIACGMGRLLQNCSSNGECRRYGDGHCRDRGGKAVWTQ